MAEPRNQPIIQLQAADLTFEGHSKPVTALHDVHLKIDAGESVAIIGPSGSGKTSLMMLIAGLEQATQGKVQVMEMDMSAADEDQLARFRQHHMGIVFQSFHLIPTMTALENVMIPLELTGAKKPRSTARQMLERVGMQDRMEHFPSQLSGGEQQRVALARAFAANPSILLADEPTGNLDVETGQLVIQQMSELQMEFNTTLVLVTHNMQLAGACERIVELENGAIINDMTREEMDAVA